MKTVTAPRIMKDVTVSPITRTHSAFLYFFPIQSWRQFVSAAGFFAVPLSFFALLFYLFDPDAMVVLWGGVIGGVGCGLYPVLPAQMQLATRGEARHFVQAVDKHIISLGYVEFRSSATSKRYRSKQPRWLRWDEQEIEIVVSGNVIEINGPVLSLRLLTRLVDRVGL